MIARLCSMVCVAALMSLTGCGGPDTTPGTEVDVTGTVTIAGAKVPAGASIYFQPTGGATLPANFKLSADGTFSGKMNAGKYTYYIGVPEGNAKLEAGMKGVPEAARKGSLDRQIEVKGGALQIQL